MLLLNLLCAAALGAQPPLKIACEIPENDLIPEGLAWDAVTGDLYLSSTWKRKIIKISPDGKWQDFVSTGQDGLLGVIGMKVDAARRLLWVATSTAGENMPVQGLTDLKTWKSGIFKYDLKTGECLQQYWLKEIDKSFFFNDLTLDSTGRVYATEMMTNRIYTITPDSEKLEIFLQLPEGHAPNGIDLDKGGRFLFVGLYTKPFSFGRLDIETKQLDFIQLPANETIGADGLYFYKNSLIAVQPGVKKRVVTQYFLDAALLKITGIKILLADDPLLAQPSTGALASDRFYFIVTSQLQVFAKHYKDNGGKVYPEKLLPVLIGVLQL